ncbi:TerC family protein [Chitinophagaceae bacterium LB-8]|uniref:TerC family protein n=1 Tax=Paraflavisolibacter caeni TaxID=2982496 RepID=A0A9X2XTA9_9BACT|nr:TerC family protein [Paraflavisolibacter caeni]MCU7548052.1 TerC family protein [Paraflavisolibacter caeni]
MEGLFSIDNIISLFTLALLEVILGIDNVIFVSIIMGRLHKSKQLNARRLWMVTGIGVRVILLFCLSWLVQQKGKPLFTVFGRGFDLASLVMIGGGLFLLYKTVKEIHHKLEGDEAALEDNATKKAASFGAAILQIIIVDMIFSFDSMITAVGIAKELPIMIIAVCIAMVIMFLFSQKISDFIHKHPTLKMLALSFLVLVAVVLLMEGWNSEQAHELHLKNYVYFAMAFSFGVELLNMRLRKRITKPVELRGPVQREEVLTDDQAH